MNEFLYSSQIAVAILTGAATGLLGFMFYNSSLSNRDPFTAYFLKFLSASAGLKVVEIAGSVYRTSRIDAGAIPIDGMVVGLIGRAIEMAGYGLLVWFLLLPETKRALNGGGTIAPLKSGDMPADFWSADFRKAIKDMIKPEFLK